MADPTGTSSAQIIRIFNNARVKLPGALDAVMQQEFFNVVDDFLRGSSLWSEKIGFTTIADGVTVNYAIAPAAGGQITTLVTVVNASGTPVSAVMYTPGTITLEFPDNQVETLTATVLKTVIDPTDSNSFPQNVPTWIYNKYTSVFTDGLTGRMMSHVAKPYSNPQLAAIHLQKFAGGTGGAYRDYLHAHTQGAQTWQFPMFDGGNLSGSPSEFHF